MTELKPYEQQAKEWTEKYYGQAVGCTIVRFEWTSEVDDEDDPDGPQELDFAEWFPVLVIRDPVKGEEYRLEISRDEEGNGPGYLFGLPMPT